MAELLQIYKNNVIHIDNKIEGLKIVQDFINIQEIGHAIRTFRSLKDNDTTNSPFIMDGLTNEDLFKQRVIDLYHSLDNSRDNFQNLVNQIEAQEFQNLNLQATGGQTTFPRQLFGKNKRNNSLQKKVMRLKYKKKISLQKAWNIVKKQENKKLKLLTLKKLRKLAKRRKISITKKNSKRLVNKKILIKRIKKNKFGTCITNHYSKNNGTRTTFGKLYGLK